MAAYIIADVNVTDQTGYEEYRRQVSATLTPYGGRFLVRGGQVTLLEGSWETGRIVILEFDSSELARRWFDSAEYAPVKAIRQQNSTGRFIMVDGV